MNFDKLKNFQIFEDLTESDINKFIKVIEKIKFDVGEKLITEGDKGDCIYLLLDGEVRNSYSITLDCI